MQQDNDGNDVGNVAEMYGYWQTEPYTVAPAQNGCVPKNQYGSVDVWNYDLKLLPQGTSYIRDLQHLPTVCKTLGIDYAPAVVSLTLNATINMIAVQYSFETHACTACELAYAVVRQKRQQCHWIAHRTMLATLS
jgi:Rad4 beta-hairpin domain 3